MLAPPPSLARRYPALRPLGRGGEGSVYMVRDALRGGRLLALKVLPAGSGPPGKANGAGADPLKNEFLVSASLAHPALARVRDFGFLPEGGAWFTSDLVAGIDLLAWGLAHPFPLRWPSFLAAAAQLLGGLHAIHSAGFVHGDVKPADILVEAIDGPPGLRVTLIDFGSARISKALSARRSGTPAYLAPERLGAGPPADLYSLGMSLYHAATGSLPFILGDAESLLAWRRAGRPARLGDRLEEVPPAAAELVERLTDTSGEGRFQSASDALDFLARKTAIAPLLPPAAEGPGRLVGRDAELEQILSLLAGPRAPLVVVSSPAGLGKSRLIWEAARRAQLDGFRTVIADPVDPDRALKELLDLAPQLSPSAFPADDPARLGAALYEAVADRRVLVAIDGLLDPATDGEEQSPGLFAPRVLLSFSRAYLRRPPRSARLIAASRRPAILEKELAPGPGRLREIRLEPLGRESIREMAAEHFRTDQVPEAVIDRLADVSRGAPGRVRAALAALDAQGAKVDPLGLVALPAERRDAGREPAAIGGPTLSPLARQALAILALGPGPLLARDVARWAPLLDPPPDAVVPGAVLPKTVLPPAVLPQEMWDTVLEELAWDGRIQRAGSSPPLYRLPADGQERPAPAPPSGNAAGIGAAERRVRARILDDLRRECPLPGEQDPDRLLALARAALPLGDPILARAARLAVRRLRARLRFADALRLIREVLGAGKDVLPPGRSRSILALRGAELALLHGGRSDLPEIRTLVEEAAGPPAPRRSRVPFLLALARIDERAGLLASAAEGLEAALSILEPSSSDPPASWYETSARLAALRYALGRPDLAAPLLSRGQDLVRRLLPAPGGVGEEGSPRPPALLEDLPGCAGALSRFGTLLARHGDPSSLSRLFTASIELAERTGRKDLMAGPLHELALVQAVRGDRTEARRALNECLRIAEDAGDRSAVLRLMVNLATLSQKEGALDQAQDLFLKARILADELGEDGPGAAAWMGLWVIRRDRGELVEALRLGRGILRRFPRSRRTLHATAHFNLGEIYLALGRPERSRRERATALAQARSCDYRFLIGYALMGLGAVRWSVGDLAGAAKRLRRAVDLAESPPPPSEGPDHLLLAAAFHYLGQVQSAAGERLASFRSFRRAMTHSRTSSSMAYLEGSFLGMVHLLLAGGHRATAAALLSGFDGLAGPAPPPRRFGRHRFLLAALAARSSPGWPSNLPALEEASDRAEAAGDILASLRILEDSLVDPALPPAHLPQLLARRDAVAGRFLRRCAPRDRAFFRRIHRNPPLLPSAESSGPSTDVPGADEPDRRLPEGPGDPLARLAHRWAEGSGILGWQSTAPAKRGDGAPGIEMDLGLLRDAIPARSLWVINEPGNREPMFYSADPDGPPLDLFTDRAPLLASAREGKGLRREGDLALIRIPGPRSRSRRERRVLCARISGEAMAGPLLGQRLELAAGLLGCLFQLRAAATGRKEDRDRLGETAREIHRLNVLLASNKGQMETAVITQRLMDVERREAEEAVRFSRGDRPRPIARGPAMQDLLRRLTRVAAEEIPVLLLGESGVGKDLLARSIHFQSPRAKGPFISEVCAIPESLLESELFGFVRGAFTGAHQDRPGLLQLCHGGTLYLDEISEMTGALQARLARVLAERQARPIGAEASVPIDLRLISSSRRSLKELEDSGDLRREFFYRIRGEVLEVPPLRERREDIPLLVDSFLHALARERGVPAPPVEPDLLSYLSKLPWPGNVRQLENEVGRAFLLHPERLTREAFQAGQRPEARGEAPPATASPSGAKPVLPLREARDGFERELVIQALQSHGGNASGAARALKITRRYLGILLEKHRIRLSDYGS